jgi:AraC-like DNA-binding protein
MADLLPSMLDAPTPGHAKARDGGKPGLPFCAMRVISHSSFRQLGPVLLWAQEKEVGPTFSRDGSTEYQGVWLVQSPGAEVGLTGLAPLRPGDWVFMPRGRRCQRFVPGTRITSIGYIAGQPSGGWFDSSGIVVLRGCDALARATLRLRRRIQAEAGDQISMHSVLSEMRCPYAAWLRIYAEFHAWLAVVSETLIAHGCSEHEEADVDRRIAMVLEALDDDPWADERDPAGLARLAGMSRRRLEQLFREQIGSGVAEHRRRQQLRSASAALEAGDQQIKQVARDLGFASASAFSTWFRRQSGRSPIAHRRGQA